MIKILITKIIILLILLAFLFIIFLLLLLPLLLLVIMSTPRRVGVHILFYCCPRWRQRRRPRLRPCQRHTNYIKGTPAQIFFGRHVFCSPGHCLLLFAMTLTFALKVKP